MYALLQKKLNGLKGDAVAFAQNLIRIPSVTLEEAEVAAAVERELEELGYDKVVHDEYGNVVGILFGRETQPTVLLVSHMDTVAQSTGGRWETDPYDAAIRDGRLYGLGASDCKGGLAAQAYAGALLKRSLLPLRGNLVFAATVAEGNGRSIGVRGLMEHTLPQLGLEPTFAVLGEPTELGLYYGHDGWVELELVVDGTSRSQVDGIARTLAATWPSGGTAHSGVELSEPLFEDIRRDDRSDARRATITMNRRLTEGEPVEAVVDEVRREAVRAAATQDAAVAVRVHSQRERLYTGHYELVRNLANAWAIDPYDVLVERARQALSAGGQNVRPRKWEFGRLGMGTAGGALVNDFHVSTVGYGPGSDALAHRSGEYVEVEKIAGAVYGTALIVHGLVGIPVFGWTSDEI